MKNILVTGVGGRVGTALLKYLTGIRNEENVIYLGERQEDLVQDLLTEYPRCSYRHFDFEDPYSFQPAFRKINCVFLVCPDSILDIERYFRPLIQIMKLQGVTEVLFLSFQGVEAMRWSRHSKIERLILEEHIPYVFLRPSYFMQNLSTLLLPDILNKQRIALPAGRACFNWVDIENVAELAALMIHAFDSFRKRKVDICGPHNYTLNEVVAVLNHVQITEPVKYRPTFIFQYILNARKEGMSFKLIRRHLLYFLLLRYRPEPCISKLYEDVTGKKPTNLRNFLLRERACFV